MADSKSPIGVFDSGVGGISVLRELVRLMPGEDYIYLGDSLHAPYGTKKLEEVRKLTIHNVEMLLEKGAKSIVVACNTATSAAVAVLRKMYPDIPLVGIEPAIKPAVMNKPDSNIIVMATPMTLKQEKFRKLMAKYDDMGNIIPLPCPGLMEFVERGDLEGEDLRSYIINLFHDIDMAGIDSIVLGCTHYPFAKKMIKSIVGESVKIYDGGAGTAREMKRRLSQSGLLNDKKEKGKVIFINSKDTEEEINLCNKLLKLPF